MNPRPAAPLAACTLALGVFLSGCGREPAPRPESASTARPDTAGVLVGSFGYTPAAAESAQARLQRGQEGWRADPVLTVQALAESLGFDPSRDAFTLITQEKTSAAVRVLHGEATYTVHLTQPLGRQRRLWWLLDALRSG